MATHKKENWRTTKLFLKRVLNPFHEQKIKENFFRRKVERTALSKSSTLISISNSQLLVRVFAFFEVLQTVCVCFFECSKLGGKCNFNSLKSFYFSRSISKLSKQIIFHISISASIFAPFFYEKVFFFKKSFFCYSHPHLPPWN